MRAGTVVLLPRDFINSLMPEAPITGTQPKPMDIQFPTAASTTSNMWFPFLHAVRDAGLCPDVTFHVATPQLGPDYGEHHSAMHESGLSCMSMDVKDEGYFAATTADLDPYAVPEEGPQNVPSSQQDDKRGFDWHKHGLMIVFGILESSLPSKYDSDSDSEYLPTEKESGMSDSEAMCEQLTLYAREMFYHQHCTHLFQLLVVGNSARFVRWDRAGAVVSAEFDYVDKNPDILADFFWRYSHMTSQERGWDEEVSPLEAGSIEKKIFEDAIKKWFAQHGGEERVKRIFPGAEKTLDADYPTFKLSVISHDIDKQQILIIQRPFSRSSNVTGKATRGYLAYRPSDNSIVFYKDGWRLNYKLILSEESVFRELKMCAVEHLAEVFYAGDAKGLQYATSSHKQAQSVGRINDKWQRECLPLRQHLMFRFVQELAYPVQALRSSRDFVCALRDCLIAIQQAMEKCRIIHGDISINNVMVSLDPDGSFVKGVLNDWDQAGKADCCLHGGTWPFMSIELMMDPKKPHQLVDDLQSVFWVLLYGALRFFDNTVVMKDNDWKIFFGKDNKSVGNKTVCVGGDDKQIFLLAKKYGRYRFTSKPLRALILKIGDEWKAYYSEAQRVKYPDSDEDSSPGSVERLQTMRQSLSDPQQWIDIFNLYLEKPDWPTDDAVPDKYEWHTAKIQSRTSRDYVELTLASSQRIPSTLGSFIQVSETSTGSPISASRPETGPNSSKRPRQPSCTASDEESRKRLRPIIESDSFYLATVPPSMEEEMRPLGYTVTAPAKNR